MLCARELGDPLASAPPAGTLPLGPCVGQLVWSSKLSQIRGPRGRCVEKKNSAEDMCLCLPFLTSMQHAQELRSTYPTRPMVIGVCDAHVLSDCFDMRMLGLHAATCVFRSQRPRRGHTTFSNSCSPCGWCHTLSAHCGRGKGHVMRAMAASPLVCSCLGRRGLWMFFVLRGCHWSPPAAACRGGRYLALHSSPVGRWTMG